MTDRYQSVVVGDFVSEELKVKFGVPQGSVLGPLLFTLFINDIFEVESDITLLFADDTASGLSDGCFDSLMIRTQRFVDGVSAWLRRNGLLLNAEKTVLMLFSNRQVNYQLPNIYYNGTILNWVESTKYLGVVIDYKLNFNLHLDKIEKQASRGQGIIYRLSNFCCKSILVKIYYSLVYSYLSHNILI